MSHGEIGFALDILILICLGVTIYYAARLTKSLNSFQLRKKEFGRLIADLSHNITQAQGAIEGLKNASKNSGESLQKTIDSSKALAEELRQVNEAGEGMARRLEALAEKNRRLSYSDFAAETVSESPASGPEDMSRPYGDPENPDTGSLPSFFIQDRDFEPDLAGRGMKKDKAEKTGGFQSQAERDLFEALQKNRKFSSGKA